MLAQEEPPSSSEKVACDVSAGGGVVRCKKCGEALDPLRPDCRSIGKVKQAFQCGTCWTVDTRLRRLLGTWPIDEVRDAKDEDVSEFYKKAATANGPHHLTIQVKDVLKKNAIRKTTRRVLEE